MYSIGFEIEFYIPEEYNNYYSGYFSNPLTDKFGYDGVGFLVKEYRSEVYKDENIFSLLYTVMYEITKVKHILKNKFNAELTPFKLVENCDVHFGTHISFGEDFLKFKYLKLICLIVFIDNWLHKYNRSLKILKTRLKIGLFRKHSNRFEFRGIPTEEQNSPILNLFCKVLWLISK